MRQPLFMTQDVVEGQLDLSPMQPWRRWGTGLVEGERFKAEFPLWGPLADIRCRVLRARLQSCWRRPLGASLAGFGKRVAGL